MTDLIECTFFNISVYSKSVMVYQGFHERLRCPCYAPLPYGACIIDVHLDALGENNFGWIEITQEDLEQNFRQLNCALTYL